MQRCILLIKFRLIPHPGPPLPITGLLAVKQKYRSVLNGILSTFHCTLAHCMAYIPCSHPFGSFVCSTICMYQTLQLKENTRHRSVTTESYDFPRLYRNQHSWLGQGDNSHLSIYFSFPSLNVAGPLDVLYHVQKIFPSIGNAVCIWLQVSSELKCLAKSHLDS